MRSDETVFPCCAFRGAGEATPGQGALREIFQGEYFQALREQMTQGMTPLGCRKCYQEEMVTGKSLRQKANAQFPEAELKEPSPVYLELSLGNICNLKCRSCSSLFSSRWAEEDAKKLGHTPKIKMLKNISEKMDGLWKGLTHLKIMGGEPFLMPAHEELLREVIAKGHPSQIQLEYSTNCTVRVSPFVLDVWSQIRHLQISFSIDGLKELNDQFRSGSDWQEIISNIHWYRQQAPRGEFNIHSVVTNYNIEQIIEMDDWLLDEFPDIWLTKDCLASPYELSIATLPQEKKRELAEYFGKMADRFSKDRRRHLPYLKIQQNLLKT